MLAFDTIRAAESSASWVTFGSPVLRILIGCSCGTAGLFVHILSAVLVRNTERQSWAERSFGTLSDGQLTFFSFGTLKANYRITWIAALAEWAASFVVNGKSIIASKSTEETGAIGCFQRVVTEFKTGYGCWRRAGLFSGSWKFHSVLVHTPAVVTVTLDLFKFTLRLKKYIFLF